MSTGPSTVVKYVTLTPPSVSLLSAAILLEESDERWVNGLNYVPDGCGEGEIFDLCDNDPITGFEKTISASSDPVTGSPFGLVAQDTCTTFSRNARDYFARATRKLLAMESALLADEVWTGSLGLNPRLADPSNVDATGSGAEPLVTAIALIEQTFYDTSPGVRPMIHMRPFVLETLLALGSVGLRREGNVWYTAMDSVIAVDRGYPGTGPSGEAVDVNTEWIYATPVLAVRRSAIVTIPNTLKDAVLRTENQVTVFAERAVQATWDNNCPTISLKVDRTP